MNCVCGMEEGIQRNHMPTAQGSRIDSIILSILKSEWLGGIKGQIQKSIRFDF